jgi:hypothetical protein
MSAHHLHSRFIHEVHVALGRKYTATYVFLSSMLDPNQTLHEQITAATTGAPTIYSFLRLLKLYDSAVVCIL